MDIRQPRWLYEGLRDRGPGLVVVGPIKDRDKFKEAIRRSTARSCGPGHQSTRPIVPRFAEEKKPRVPAKIGREDMAGPLGR